MVPNLESIVSLVGVTTGVLTAFIFPPLLQMIVYWEDWTVDRRRWYKKVMIAKSCSIIGFGLFAAVVGLYATIADIVNNYYAWHYKDHVINA